MTPDQLMLMSQPRSEPCAASAGTRGRRGSCSGRGQSCAPRNRGTCVSAGSPGAGRTPARRNSAARAGDPAICRESRQSSGYRRQVYRRSRVSSWIPGAISVATRFASSSHNSTPRRQEKQTYHSDSIIWSRRNVSASRPRAKAKRPTRSSRPPMCQPAPGIAWLLFRGYNDAVADKLTRHLSQ